MVTQITNASASSSRSTSEPTYIYYASNLKLLVKNGKKYTQTAVDPQTMFTILQEIEPTLSSEKKRKVLEHFHTIILDLFSDFNKCLYPKDPETFKELKKFKETVLNWITQKQNSPSPTFSFFRPPPLRLPPHSSAAPANDSFLTATASSLLLSDLAMLPK
ncbi:hypothetical protein JYU14_05190 [Simkania negevensis]|uniref:Uncharacterized protein n=1 Tax=Simkania negevensis TaxID=83561 RepID=A0ABS3ASY3_9BACT|nr:hypothetical protein [Simkania negevensis]